MSIATPAGATLDAQRISQADLNSLVRTVSATSMNHQDAEDAVQDAWLVLHQKAPQLEAGPVNGYLVRTARFKALHAREKATKTTSLDGLVEVAGDSVSALSDGAFSLDAYAGLAELSSDPIGAGIVHSARNGGAPYLAPRGENHRNARYTDAQVDQVRELRKAGLGTRAVEAQTGVPAGYVSMLARRTSRVVGTTEGWSRTTVLAALQGFQKRHGRAPLVSDDDPLLPSLRTVERHVGTWRDACRDAGAPSIYDGRRMQRWTVDEMVRAFCTVRLEFGRWPTREEIQAHAFPSLPGLATIRRHLGTTSRAALKETVTAGLDV
jgi:hypothetical protein